MGAEGLNLRFEAVDAPAAVVDPLRRLTSATTTEDAPIVRLFRGPQTPIDAFEAPVSGIIEWQETKVADPEPTVDTVASGGVAAALFTRTAIQAPLARQLSEAVTRRAPTQPDEDFHDRLETALHEALANACLHGNLGLSVSDQEGSLDAFHAAVAERTQTDEFGLLTVCIAAEIGETGVTIVVRDEGAGFHPNRTGDPGEPYSGRGLTLMWAFADELTFRDDGREVVMVFNWRRA